MRRKIVGGGGGGGGEGCNWIGKVGTFAKGFLTPPLFSLLEVEEADTDG